MMTPDPWVPILKQLHLSRAEKAAVERYQSTPHGRTFLPIADILLGHHLVDECIELLMQGVERHPRFTVARVILARELFNKGMVAEAWRTLEATPESLDENVLAQKIRFKLALILNKEKKAHQIYNHIQLHRMYDAETKRLGDLMNVREFGEVRVNFLDDLAAKGIVPIDFDLEVDDPMATLPVALNEEPERAYAVKSDLPFDESEQKKIAGFHVVPLQEIFALAVAEHETNGKGAAELDSTTLAGIYESQGHYHKALDIYRRLLKFSPNSDFLRMKIAEITRLRREQKEDDLAIDASVVEKMETLEIVNCQIQFLNRLLTKLD